MNPGMSGRSPPNGKFYAHTNQSESDEVGNNQVCQACGADRWPSTAGTPCSMLESKKVRIQQMSIVKASSPTCGAVIGVCDSCHAARRATMTGRPQAPKRGSARHRSRKGL